MDFQPASTLLLDDPSQALADSSYPSLCASARMEFQASLQLLAERASFLTAATGVAIALFEGSSLSYCAAVGSKVSLTGNTADPRDPIVEDCIRNRRLFRLAADGQFKLLAPISNAEKAIGFFELTSKYEWTDRDAGTVTRLAEMVEVAVEHRVAAETVEASAWRGPQEHLTAVAWHAPEKSDLAPVKAPATEPAKITVVNVCGACGFPVSPGRDLCVECEQKSDIPVSTPPELFSTQNQANWISEHGYTVASLIVSALAAVIILCLRH